MILAQLYDLENFFDALSFDWSLKEDVVNFFFFSLGAVLFFLIASSSKSDRAGCNALLWGLGAIFYLIAIFLDIINQLIALTFA